MSALFLNFLTDPYLRKVLIKIKTERPELISYLACHELPTEEFFMTPFLDLSLLYNSKNITKAFGELQPEQLCFSEAINLGKNFFYIQKSIDRVSPIPNSAHYNENYFWELCMYLKSFFLNNPSIKNIIFEATPHLPHDLIIFFVAKELNIKTLILKRTSIAGFSYIAEDFRYENNFWKFNYNFENNLKTIFQKKNLYEMIEDLKNLEFAKDQVQGQWPEELKKSNNLSTLLKKIINNIKIFNLIIIFLRYMKDIFSFPYIQKSGASKNFFLSSTFSHNNNINYLNYIKLKFQYRKRLNKLKEEDAKSHLNIEILKNKKYIFFPLHFQPEASTLPEGGIFENQYLSLKLISKSLPDDYILVVKEHPKQLNYDIRNKHFRTISFYRKIRKLENTLLFSSQSNYDELLKNSSLVATISGSVAWQGLLNGKPGVVFADMWLNDCKSIVMYQKCEKNFKKMIIELTGQSKESVFENIKFFLNNNSNFFFESVIFHKHQRFTNNVKKCIEQLAYSIIKRLK